MFYTDPSWAFSAAHQPFFNLHNPRRGGCDGAWCGGRGSKHAANPSSSFQPRQEPQPQLFLLDESGHLHPLSLLKGSPAQAVPTPAFPSHPCHAPNTRANRFTQPQSSRSFRNAQGSSAQPLHPSRPPQQAPAAASRQQPTRLVLIPEHDGYGGTHWTPVQLRFASDADQGEEEGQQQQATAAAAAAAVPAGWDEHILDDGEEEEEEDRHSVHSLHSTGSTRSAASHAASEHLPRVRTPDHPPHTQQPLHSTGRAGSTRIPVLASTTPAASPVHVTNTTAAPGRSSQQARPSGSSHSLPALVEDLVNRLGLPQPSQRQQQHQQEQQQQERKHPAPPAPAAAAPQTAPAAATNTKGTAPAAPTATSTTSPVKTTTSSSGSTGAGSKAGAQQPQVVIPVVSGGMTRSQAARLIQRWWRGHRIRGQAEALHVLKRQNAALKAATAKFDEYLGAADGLTSKQCLEISELSMRVLLALDSTPCVRPELRAVKKRLTSRALALQDQAAAAYAATSKASSVSGQPVGLSRATSALLSAAVAASAGQPSSALSPAPSPPPASSAAPTEGSSASGEPLQPSATPASASSTPTEESQATSAPVLTADSSPMEPVAQPPSSTAVAAPLPPQEQGDSGAAADSTAQVAAPAHATDLVTDASASFDNAGVAPAEQLPTLAAPGSQQEEEQKEAVASRGSLAGQTSSISTDVGSEEGWVEVECPGQEASNSSAAPGDKGSSGAQSLESAVSLAGQPQAEQAEQGRVTTADADFTPAPVVLEETPAQDSTDNSTDQSLPHDSPATPPTTPRATLAGQAAQPADSAAAEPPHPHPDSPADDSSRLTTGKLPHQQRQ